MTHNFDNVKFNNKLYNNTAKKWKDFDEGVYKIVDKLSVMGKFGQNYILEVVDKHDNVSKVYTPKEITEYLHKNSPKFIKVVNNNGVNQAQFA